MSYSSLLSLALCFLLLFHGAVVQADHRQRQPRQHRSQQDECQLHRLTAAEPSKRIQSEAGVSEIWDQNQQFRCAGVIALRHTIEERGLLLPQYVNGPKLFYVVQGRGIHGAVYPGCPETYQESQSESSEREGQRQGDHHQKVRQLRRGDVVALREGVAQWVYNNGNSPLVLVQIVDLSNPGNQLDQNLRAFFLAGNPEQESQREKGEYAQRGERRREQGGRNRNVFAGIDDEVLAEAFNVNTELARRLKGENDKRGIIVRVEGELEVLSPRQRREEEEEERERKGRRNGIEETFCTDRLKHNIDNPSHADVYNPRAGRVANVNSFNLPILRYLQLSVQKGVLYRNAILAPHWNINAHSVHYFTEGNGNVQVVDDNGNKVFDGEVREGQILIVPQNFVVVKRANNEGLEWVAFKTNENAQISQLAGGVSVIRALPEDVVANAYQVSREEARRITNNREEVTVLSPGFRSQS